VALCVPVGLLQKALLVGRNNIAAFLLKLIEKALVDCCFHQQIAIGGAARAVIVGLADACISGGLLDVRCFVDTMVALPAPTP
jgi:hypothetical protein